MSGISTSSFFNFFSSVFSLAKELNSGLSNDLEELGFAYLRTWVKSNNEILDILKKEKSKSIRFKTQLGSKSLKG